jgi:hypothetical protein
MNRILIPLVGCLASVLILLTFRAGQAQQESATYFPETGHYVDEPFLSRLLTEGGVQLWGPPITEAFEENGLTVQYFERSRMECASDAHGACDPRLSPLGELLGHQTPRVTSVPEALIRDDLCRYYPETGHNVCFSFLAFYLESGGPEILGPPISELTVGPGVILQYFRRARIEWHTDVPATAAMRLGPLGREHFTAKGLDPSLLSPAESPPVSAAATQVTGVILVGGQVRVASTDGAGLRLRSGPGLDYAVIETLGDGLILRVVEGPQINDGFVWWRLERDGSLGWCASEWLEPVSPP